MSEYLSNPIVLPEIVRPLAFAFGQSPDKSPQTVTFLYRTTALTRNNYAHFVALLDEGAARATRKRNAALQADRENLTAALQEDAATALETAPEAAHYTRLSAALESLGDDLDRARELALAEESSSDFIDRVVQQIGLVNGFLKQMEMPDVRTDEEMEKEIEARRTAAIEANAERAETAANMLAHLCKSFYFADENRIDATPDNLKTAFDTVFLEQACREIQEAFHLPLGRVGGIES